MLVVDNLKGKTVGEKVSENIKYGLHFNRLGHAMA